MTAAIRHLSFDDPDLTLRLEGLERDEAGVLRLARLPGGGPALDVVDPALALSGPVAVAVNADGTVYLADPDGHRVLRVDCDGDPRPLACLSGPGDAVGRVRGPRGLLAGPRHALYVADTGNHRILVLDLATLQVRGVWGATSPSGAPRAGQAPGEFRAPWDLAADAADRIYVADRGNHRVQRLDADGRPDPDFWTAMAASRPPHDPTGVVVAELPGGERLVVLDRGLGGSARGAVLAYGLDGVLDATETARLEEIAARLAGPAAALATAPGCMLVADPTGLRVLAFDASGAFLGEVPAAAGAITGLAFDARGRLIVGANDRVAALAGAGRAESGRFLLGPVAGTGDAEGWTRVRALAERAASGGHVRLFTFVGSPGGLTPALPREGGGWRAGPLDALDLRVEGQAGDLWIGGRLTGDGTGTPALEGLSVDPSPDSWLRHLPGVYADDATTRRPLEQLLALCQSMLGDEQELIEGMPVLLDPQAAPAAGPGSWLDWLADRVAAEIDAGWPEARRREVVAGAFARHARRGTAEGLIELARLHADASISVWEPAARASLWALDGGATLGVTTMLAAAEAQGAVLDTSAVVDGSHLIEREDYGAPAFADLAGRICVSVPAGDVREPRAMVALERLLERERPAHATVHLCVVDARMRIGAQARIGVDAIVGAIEPSRGRLGIDTALAAPAPRTGGAVGETTLAGRGTTLT